ncbi:MAG: phosphoglucosamine mutase [Bacteroidia bacterium]|nr:phosphoglucosamine mutase [Bacteroidia bacterium]
MALIKSISGIRGTIGGSPGDGLTPLDLVKFTAAYLTWAKTNQKGSKKLKIVVGRDARISGAMVDALVSGTLLGMGADVVNLGLASTPTTELAVLAEKADGGIILTASHNPKQWNALKLLNSDGEFLNDQEGKIVLEIAQNESFEFASVDNLGAQTFLDYTQYHIQHVLDLALVDVEAIKRKKFKVAVDAVNSVGGIIVPQLLRALGVVEVLELNCTPDGHFPHNPEPIPENLMEISAIIAKANVDVCFVVDPDVDRLAIINEDGTLFNEEYTLVAVADYVLSNSKGNTVSNLSSSRALRDITERYGATYNPSAVGEVNVTTMMKNTNAVIGGEGNGGVIYPMSHYGRDSMVGIALFLTHLAKSGLKCTKLRATYPDYFISKNKIELTPTIDVDDILLQVQARFQHEEVNTVDGVKIDFDKEWVHLRKSNTEPIIRIYAESRSMERADALAEEMIEIIKQIARL